MLQADQAQFDIAIARERARRVLGSRPLANGQPVADALAVALVHDMRAGGADVSELQALRDFYIYDAGLSLSGVLAFGGRGSLPFGTEMTGVAEGAVEIAGQAFVMDAGRPGLHPVETTRRDAHGPNLDLLRTLIERKTRRLACRRMGLPTPSFICEADSRHLLQFPPCPEAGGVMLQRFATETGAARFCSATPKLVASFAAEIVEDMRAFWRRRSEIAKAADEVRGAVEEGIQEAEGCGREVRLAKLLIDMRQHRDGDALSFYLEYEGLDEALRSGLVLDYRSWRDDLDKRPLQAVPMRNEWRARDLAELRAMGADSRVDDVASAVIRSAREGASAVLERLGRDLETSVIIPSSGHEAPLFATLYWRNGVVQAEVSMGGRLDVDRDVFELRGARLPETVVAAMVGRPLSDTISLPIDLGCPVVEATSLNDGGLRARLAVGTSLMNTRSGRIWSEPGETRGAA